MNTRFGCSMPDNIGWSLLEQNRPEVLSKTFLHILVPDGGVYVLLIYSCVLALATVVSCAHYGKLAQPIPFSVICILAS